MEENKFTMETPYTELKRKYSNPSKHYYMLSELIDNSIGSWDNKISKSLEIKITIDSPSKIIKCWDNASGMDLETLGNSIRMNKTSDGNKMNMYGVGMKNCAFWLGQDLKIETNDGIDAYETSVYLSQISEEDLNKTIQWEVRKGTRPTRGTTINIFNVHNDRIIKREEHIRKYIDEYWSTKYMKYIEKGVNIVINFIDKNGDLSTHQIPLKKIKAQIIPEKFVEQFIKNLQSRSEHLKVIHSLKEDAINKVKSNQMLEFNYTLPFKSYDGCSFDFTFGIQNQIGETTNENKDYKRDYGLTTFQGSRGINIAPKNPLAFGEYTRTDIKRVYGFVELGDFFKPDNNKQNFIFGSVEGGNLEEEFKTWIKDIGSDLYIIANTVKDTIGKNVITSLKENTPSIQKKLTSSLNAKTSNVWEVTKLGATTHLFNDIYVEIEQLSINNEDDKDYFISSKIIDNDMKKIHIKYNSNHPIWKPLSNNNSSIEIQNVLYPLIAILGVSDCALKNNWINEKMGFESDDFFSVLNNITKVVIK